MLVSWSRSAACSRLIFGLFLLLALLPDSIVAQVDPGQLGQVPGTEPLPTGKINMGPNINTMYSDLFPVITPDETVLFFTRKGTPENTGASTNSNDEDIWYSVKDENGHWSLAKQLEGPLNTTTYDGVRAINSTATRLYLQNIYRQDGTRGKGFSVSHRASDGSWLFPEPLEIEDYYNDTTIAMMAISQAEDVILFSLKRKDGLGKHDLYLSKHLGGNRWARPKLLEALSTAGDEISPFMAFDDRTLYYSTDGNGGLGLHDIFMTRRLDESWENWSTPVNLGEGVNTPSFDAYLMVSAHGDTAYFSSVHESSARGYGKSDIWKVALSKRNQPGSLYGARTVTDPPARASDYYGSLFRLDSVFFDTDKSKLRPESKEALDRLLDLLQKFPGLSIEVQGHTDSDAEEDYNMELSVSRAFSVRQYLLTNGIEEERVAAKGYGELFPIAPNTTPEGKQLNRRVMVLIKGE